MSGGVVLSWSGGKDSALALWAMREELGTEPAALLTTMNGDHGRVSIHGVRRELVRAQAEAVGLPLVEVEIPTGASNELYEERLDAALDAPPLDAHGTIAFADLFLADIRAYREGRLAAIGRRATFPLWGRDTSALARRFIDAGFEATLVCVDTEQLAADFVGRSFDAALLEDLPSSVDPCGENGEFHTFVSAGPIFAAPIATRFGERHDAGRFVYRDLVPARAPANPKLTVSSSSMILAVSEKQRHELDKMLREGPLDMGGELAEQRQVMTELMGELPLPDDVKTEESELGGVGALLVETGPSRADRTVLYLHGGAYALGDAKAGVGLASEVARRCRARAYSVDYRLAPEHPYPAGVEDCVAAYRGLVDSGLDPAGIALVGESAGAGLVAMTLARLADAGLPQPACGALMSPWADLTLEDPMIAAKGEVDPVLTADGLRRRRSEYLGDGDPRSASPVFAVLTGVAPLLIQAGSHEILAGDALHLARRAIECEVRVDLQVWPGVPHVFQGFAATLDEGIEALDALGRFLDERLSADGASA